MKLKLSVLAVCTSSVAFSQDLPNLLHPVPLNQLTGNAVGPSVSRSGNKVAFWTNSSGLTNSGATPAILVYDRDMGTFELCSQGLSQVSRPTMSRDGKWVAFYGVGVSGVMLPYAYQIGSGAPTPCLVTSTFNSTGSVDAGPGISDEIGSTGFPRIVFPDLDRTVIPRQTNKVAILSWRVGQTVPVGTPPQQIPVLENVSEFPSPRNGDSSEPSIDASGTIVAFTSAQTDPALSPSGVAQIWRSTRNATTGAWSANSIFSYTPTTPSAFACSEPQLSGAGDVAIFSQAGSNTSDGEVWVRDHTYSRSYIPYPLTRTLTAQTRTWSPAISPDGLRVAFVSYRLHRVTNNDVLDWYPSGPTTTVALGNIVAGVYNTRLPVRTSPLPSPLTLPRLQSYHLLSTSVTTTDGTVVAAGRKLRSGLFPSLSDPVLTYPDGDVRRAPNGILVFDSVMDRIREGNWWPSVRDWYYVW